MVISIGRVIEECIEAKRNANRRKAYLRNLEMTLKALARGRETLSIDQFTLQITEQFIKRRPAKPSTVVGEITRISTLYSFARKRGYRFDNPCEHLERISVDAKPPKIFSPIDAELILRYCKKHMPWRLPHVVLGLFCGIRPHELQRLFWRDIHLPSGVVIIDSAASKVRQRRIVPLSDNCVAWLRTCVPNGKPIGAVSNKWIWALERELSISWHSDILRHTAASFLLAKHQDTGRVARWLGNSPNVLLRFYTELVMPEDCLAFWNIRP